MSVRYALAALILFLAPAAAAQTCPSNTIAELSLSDVRARLFTNGKLFFNGGGAEYEVPKGSGNTAMFGLNLWVSGVVDGQDRVAATTYGFGGQDPEFFPGRLGDDGAPTTDCERADRIYRVTAPELAAYDAGNPSTASLAAWPVGLGAPAVDAQGNPIEPTSPDQTVDLEAGERPVIYGTETFFWVMNDVGPHISTGSQPLGIEVRMVAFSVNDPDQAALDQATFYRYQIVNKSGAPIDDLRVGMWTEYDLGDGSDDFVASDAARSLSIGYNADNDDTFYGVPPAAGLDVLSGASSLVFYENANNVLTGRPRDVDDFTNLLRGLWIDGTPLSRGGLGYDPGNSDVTNWHWDGDPATLGFWTEDNIDGQGTARDGGDRRAVVSTAPVDLAPGASHTVDVGVLFAQGTDRLDSVTELRAASDLVQARYDDGSLFETTSGDLGLPPVTAPALLAPADGAVFTPPQNVRLEWAAVDGADRYQVQLRGSADEASQVYVDESVEGLSFQVPFEALPQASNDPVYWLVSAQNDSGTGPASEVRSFVYALDYEPAVQLLSNDQPAFLEVAGPGGADPCGDAAGSTFGCEEAGGNAVYVLRSTTTLDANGTGAYALTSLSPGPEDSLPAFAPRDFEIRFTAAGSIGYHRFGDGDGNEMHRVPFEVWDIGLVPLGADGVPMPNDPSDDVQLVPILFSDGDAGAERGVCAFNLDEVPASAANNPLGVPLSDRIYAYYPTATYADFNAAAAPLVDAAPDACYDDADGLLGSLIDLDGGRPIQRVVVADLTGSGSAADLEGTVIRFHTTDPQPVAGDAAPTASALALTVAPNPSRGAARVSFTLPTAGTVRVRVVDTLGRTVAVLADGERAAGPHAATLPRGLAAGIYVVTVEAGDARATQTLTVVR